MPKVRQLSIQNKNVTHIKKINIVFAVLFLILNSCHSNPKKNIWKTERFNDYLFKIPASCKLYFYSKSSEHAIVSNGNVIDGIVSGGDINIDFFEGYGYPTIYDAGATTLKIKSIGSVKEKMQTYASGSNRGLILICIWDTLKSTGILNSRPAYKEFILTERNVDSVKKKILIEIFNSIKKKEITPTWRKNSDKRKKVRLTEDSKSSPQAMKIG